MDGVRIATSGWTYAHWSGPFYPAGLPRARWREYYTRHFTSVELNASFYRWPGPRPFESWSRALPEGFRMSIKASRWLSHGHRLRDPDSAWADRLTAAIRALGDRAGVALVQLPGDFTRDDEVLEAFLSNLPSDVPAAMELRHPSWDHDDVAAILEHHGAAFVLTHGAGLHTVDRTSAPFVYCRWHGPADQPLYSGRYSSEELRDWAARIRAWRDDGREIWGYFDNDGHAYAPQNALELIELLRQ